MKKHPLPRGKPIRQLRDKTAGSNAPMYVIIIFAIAMISITLFTYCTAVMSAYSIRKTVTYEISCLQASITEDVYDSMTEKSFLDYEGVINSNKEYYRQTFLDELAKDLSYTGSYYTIDKDSINYDISASDDNVTYSFVCDVEFHINTFNGTVTFAQKDIRIDGSYNFKGFEKYDEYNEYDDVNEYGDNEL